MESRKVKIIQLVGVSAGLLVTLAILFKVITGSYLLWYLLPVVLVSFNPDAIKRRSAFGSSIQTFAFVCMGLGVAEAMPEGVVSDDIIDMLLTSKFFVVSIVLVGGLEVARRFNDVRNA